MNTPSVARRVWSQVTESRKPASEVSVCEPRVSFPLPLRLCVWAVALPFGLALSLLWGIRRPPARRLRRLRRAFNRRRHPRIQVSVPSLWRPLPSSFHGPASGPSSPPVTAPESTGCESVWDGQPCDPYLADLIAAENRQYGPPTGAAAASSRGSGTPSRSATGGGSSTPDHSVLLSNGSPYCVGPAGPPVNSPTPSPACGASPAVCPGKATDSATVSSRSIAATTCATRSTRSSTASMHSRSGEPTAGATGLRCARSGDDGWCQCEYCRTGRAKWIRP